MKIVKNDYKKIASILIYFVFVYLVLSQKDNGSKYFTLVKMIEFGALLIIYHHVKSKLLKNNKTTNTLD